MSLQHFKNTRTQNQSKKKIKPDCNTGDKKVGTGEDIQEEMQH